MKAYNQNYAIVSVKQDGAPLPEGYSVDPISQLVKLDLKKRRKTATKFWLSGKNATRPRANPSKQRGEQHDTILSIHSRGQ